MSDTEQQMHPVERNGIACKLAQTGGGVIAVVAQTEERLLSFLRQVYPDATWDRKKFARCHVAPGEAIPGSTYKQLHAKDRQIDDLIRSRLGWQLICAGLGAIIVVLLTVLILG